MRMLEIGTDTFGPLRDAIHDARGFLQEILFRAGGGFETQGRFEVVIQVFVGIGFRGVGWQVEEFDLVQARLDPLLDELGVMHTQVIDEQEDLGRRLLEQTFKERDETLGIDGPFDDLKTDFAAIGVG